MKTIVALALAASVSLCVAGCAADKLPIPPSQLLAAGDNLAPTIKIIAAQDGADQATVDQIGDFVAAVQSVAHAYVDASAACAGVDHNTCVLLALNKADAIGDALLANPSISKLIGATWGPKVADGLRAFHTALLAAQDAKDAASATDQADRLAKANAALLQLNFAVLQGIQAAR